MARQPPPRRPLPPPRPSSPGLPPRPAAPGLQAPAVAAAIAEDQVATSAPPPEQRGEDYVLPKTFFVGRYRVVDEIGVGGMASVHLARVDGPGGFQKWVAIKRIHPHLVEDDQFVDMFLDEARIAAGINHANVAQVFDLGKDEATYWIAMEYLHGEPLRELMRRLDEQGAIIPFALAARIVADGAEGLHGAHELRGRNGQLLNLVHRDVTPHNLFVTYDGYTKVVDFGIAKVVDRLASTRAGTLKGKLAYMSPEQVRGQEVDRRTDIFALGVVLWELTTNKRLFRMDTDLDTLEKVQACIVPLPSQVVPGYPRDLEEVVMRALAQRQEDRYQTAREFSRALQGFLMRQGTFVGPEDVGDYMKRTFSDRVVKRENYLEWAAEVTSTVDVEQLRAQKAAAAGLQSGLQVTDPSESHLRGAAGAAAVPPVSPAQGPAALPPPVAASGQQQPPAELASTSLMDEDEDIPTRVAGQDERPVSSSGVAPLYPVASSSGPGASGPGAVSQPEHRMERTAGMPNWQQPGAPAPSQPEADDDEDMNATIALPDNPQAREIRREIEHREAQMAAAGYPAQATPGPPATQPAPSPMVPPTAQIPAVPPQPPQLPVVQPAPQPMQQVPSAPVAPMAAPGAPVALTDHLGVMQEPIPGQSNVETKMSMPRPAAVSQWIAEQGTLENPGPRSTPVLMAIALLSTLCVIGVGALVAYKIRVGDQSASVHASALPSDTHQPLAPERSSSNDTSSSSPTASKDPKPPSKPSTKPSGGGPAPGKPVGTGALPTASAEEKGEGDSDPGFLTVFCNPACDQVIAGGRSLGASPVVNASLPPGQHRVTLKRSGGPTKVISVIIVSGQVTSQRVSMK